MLQNIGIHSQLFSFITVISITQRVRGVGRGVNNNQDSLAVSLDDEIAFTDPRPRPQFMSPPQRVGTR